MKAKKRDSVDLVGFGERVRALRERKELTQEDFARIVGARSASDVSRWERGLVAPRAENLVALAHALGCSLDYLLLGSEHSSAANGTDRLKEFLVTPLGQEAVKRGWDKRLRALNPPEGMESGVYQYLVFKMLELSAEKA